MQSGPFWVGLLMVQWVTQSIVRLLFTTLTAFVQASDDVHLESQVERFCKLDMCHSPSDGKEMSIEDKEVLQRWDTSVCK